MKKIKLVFALLGVSLMAHGQNTLRFTKVVSDPDKNVQLYWASNTNEYYEIDYADSLIDTNTGSTTWNMLYDDYPSQGTNTFWMDAGNLYVPSPQNSPMRFYRVMLEGTNTTTADGLMVAVTSPTNGTVVSGNVAVQVIAGSSNLLSKPILYLDGEEMNPSVDGTNYIINTCETWNGTHTLFAVAKSQSGLEGNKYDLGITYDRAVSPMINITIENLITDFSFSHRFFQPSLGQTQQFSAAFTANCNWTLQILDSDSNAVRTVTGSGDSMGFNWDGTGDGETNIPDAVYTYLLTANTNGLAPQELLGGGSESLSNITELWATPISGGSAAPLAIYPPGFDTNNLYIFSASESEIESSYSEPPSLSAGDESGGHFTPDDMGSAGSSQSTSDSAPKNALGTIGTCYQQYLNPNIKAHDPTTGWPYPVQPQYVAIDGYAASSSASAVSFQTSLQTKTIADGFTKEMGVAGYLSAFEKGNDNVKINDLKKTSLGGNSIFNNVNFGLLIVHGSYGTTAEDDSVKYTYIWIENLQSGNAQYLHLSDLDFGGSDPTNGLRWMTIFACDTLQQSDYNSMNLYSKIPVNDNLHILLSGSSVIWLAPDIGNNYANNLTFNNETIVNSWFDAGTQTYLYQHKGITNNVSFAYTGWPACVSDTLKSYSSPDSGDGLQYSQTTVYTLP
jgi:hypothetical protein